MNGSLSFHLDVAVITVSDRSSQGLRPDESGPLLVSLLGENGFKVVRQLLIPDEKPLITETLLRLCDQEGCALILTTGGTGLHPRDVTPEATQEVIEKEIPGIGEAMRAESLKKTPFGMVSRGIAGIRGQTLIVNFPGSPKAIRETFPVIRPILKHAVKLLGGGLQDCAEVSGGG